MSARGILPAISTCLFLLALTSPADAILIRDPKAPMQWSEMTACELVVVGKYEKHDGMTLHLRVVKVLKGKDTKSDDILPVALEHWYSIETGLTGFDRWNPVAKPDGVPKLCYKRQFENPGLLEPYKLIPDVREPAVYFFPDAKKPALSRLGQVQSTAFADGWEQALTGKPMDLKFRLMQTVNEDLSYDGMEELARTRDPKLLRELVHLTTRPLAMGEEQGSDRILAVVSDRNGDVYEPLMDWFTGPGKTAEGFGAMETRRRVVYLLGTVNGKRAFQDFAEAIKERDDRDKFYFTRHLGLLRTEDAIGLCIQLLQDPKLAEPARESLSLALNYSVPEDVQRRIGPLLPFARPRILAAFKSGRVPANVEQSLRSSLESLLGEPKGVRPDAETLLLDPNSPLYHGDFNSDARKTIGAIEDAADPRFIPLLAKIPKAVPDAWAYRDQGGYQGTLSRYAELFPNAVRKALEEQGVLALNAGNPEKPVLGYHTLMMIGGPVPPKEMYNLGSIATMTFKRIGKGELLAQYRRWVSDYVKDTFSDAYPHLQLLLTVDPQAGMSLLKEAVDRLHAADPGTSYPRYRAGVLALAIRHGIAAPVDELIGEVKKAAEGEHSYYYRANSSSYRYLLASGDARAYKLYLEVLDGCKRTVPSPYDGGSCIDLQYQGMLWELKAEHGADFFKRLLDLAASPSIAERRLAEWTLRSFRIDFRYEAGDLESRRNETLKQLRPLCEKLAPLSEIERERYLLGLHGVRLEEADWKAWLPALVEAAGSFDEGVSDTAINLIERLVEQGETGYLRCRTEERPRVMRDWLADRGFLLKHR